MYKINKLQISLLTLILPLAAAGQSDLYIPAGATVYYFGHTAIYGNMTNNGSLGTIANDTVTFYGTNWVNGSTASFPTVGAGGTISFTQPRPAPFASNGVQYLNGGYTSGANPSMPGVDINNPNNLSLLSTNTRVLNNLNFTSGKILLNTSDLVMGSGAGNGGAGTISNYDQNKYVVSNSTVGHLVKESYTGAYTFPVGKSAGGGAEYTPAKITNNTANGIHVNVSDYAGYAVAPRTSNTGIDRTWNIYADNAGGNSNIDLEHDNSTNQVSFRNSAQFVTRYVGVAPNTAGDLISFDAWERNIAGPGIMPGTLTTGAPIVTASERDRTYTSFATTANANSAYYTKASGPMCINVRAYVEGSLLNNGGATTSDGRPLMRDNLRNSPFTNANYIPVKDPYEFPTQFVNITGSYAKVAPQTGSFSYFQQVTDSATVFGVTGQNAIVDWVFIELRNKANNATVQATRAALIQRDGDIVEVDGKSCLSFPNVAIDSYYVAVRHRSHLGAMTQYAQSTSNLETLINLTDTATKLYDKGMVGSNSYAGLATNNHVIAGYRALWQGDFDANRKVKYSAPNDDNNILLGEVLAFPANTGFTTGFDFAYGYFQGDYDMNSKDKFSAPNDDQNLLIGQILGYPLNTAATTGFDFMIEQLP